MTRRTEGDECPHCGAADHALRMRDHGEEMILCRACYRVWVRPEKPGPAVLPTPANPVPPTRA